MVLDWICVEERLFCCSQMEAGGEEKKRQTQNYLVLHCTEGQRQTRMEHMDKSKTGSKQPPTVERRCLGPCAPTGALHLCLNSLKQKSFNFLYN